MLLSNAGFSIPSWQFRPATSGGKRGRYPLHFFENRKKVPWFCKKVPWFWKNVSWCASIGQILIKNAVSRASSRKKTKSLPYGPFLLCVIHKTFIKMPLFRETSPAQKNSWLLGCNCIPFLLAENLFRTEYFIFISICLSILRLCF